jgi:serine phosphatase RsbU (regulator of sigma subunit)
MQRFWIHLFFILSFLGFFCGAAWAQKNPSDSLQQLLRKATFDEQLQIYKQLIESSLDTEPATAFSYAQAYLKLAKTQPSADLLSNAHTLFALCYEAEGKIDQALQEYQEALLHSESMNDRTRKAGILYNIGRIYADKSIYDKALASYFDALRIYERSQVTPLIKADVMHEIGEVYNTLQKPKEGIDFLSKALLIREEQKDSVAIAATCNSLAISHSDMGNHQEAVKYYLRSHELCKALGYPRGIYTTASNIGYEYYTLKDNLKALEYYNIALETLQEYEELKGREAALFVNMSYIFFDEGNYAEAIEYQLKSIAAAEQIKNYNILQEAFQAIARSYASTGAFEKAYQYHISYMQVRDTIFKQENIRQIEEMQAKYNFEKKEIEIQNARQEQEIATLRSRQILFGTVAGGLVALAFIVMLVRQNRIKERNNEQLLRSNQLLAEKNEEIQRQSEVIQETNLKITDSIQYARRIQNAIMPESHTLQSLFPESFLLLKPRDIVSGDFYWCGEIGQQLVIAVADCTGHGVPGAFMTIMGASFLNQIVFEDGVSSPAEILSRLDQKIMATIQKQEATHKIDDGMDIAICAINFQSQELAFAGARRPLYLFRQQELREIKGNKFPIGGNPKFYNKHFSNHVIRFQKDDMLYLFSDGYADQFGGVAGTRKLMIRNFKRLLTQVHTAPIPHQQRVLEEAFRDWQGKQKQTDDVVVVGIRL